MITRETWLIRNKTEDFISKKFYQNPKTRKQKENETSIKYSVKGGVPLLDYLSYVIEETMMIAEVFIGS